MAPGGCGRGETRPAGTPDDALEILATALDAWRDGRAPDELQSGDPAFYVADEDWESGKTLKSYETPGAAVSIVRADDVE